MLSEKERKIEYFLEKLRTIRDVRKAKDELKFREKERQIER